MAESELGLLESFRATGEIDELHFFMHDRSVNWMYRLWVVVRDWPETT